MGRTYEGEEERREVLMTLSVREGSSEVERKCKIQAVRV